MSDLLGVWQIRLSSQRGHQHDRGYDVEREGPKYLTKHGIPHDLTGLQIDHFIYWSPHAENA